MISLIRSVSETILKGILISDLQLSDIARSRNDLLPIQSILKDLSLDLSKGISIHSGTESRLVNEEDSLYLIEPIVKNLHIMYNYGKSMTNREKSEWTDGWKLPYLKLQAQYETISEIVEE